MAKGRAVAIVLEAREKSELTALTRKHGAPQVLAERARIVLARSLARLGRMAEARQVAETEGVPVGTAKTRIRYGLQKLRAALLPEDADDE